MSEERREYLELLEELVTIPSPSQHEKTMANRVAQILTDMGYQPQVQEVGEDSANIVCSIPGGDGPTILLGGHIDTVEVCQGWQHVPLALTVEGDRAYGLGASDMKGGIAAILTVLRRFARLGEKPRGNILFAGLADEERLSLGAHRFVQDAPKADFAILAEPHYDEFIIGATGKILLELTVTGHTGHAARPEEGVSAVEAAAAFLTALDSQWRPRYQAGEMGSHCALRIWSDWSGYSLAIPEVCHILLNKQLLPQEREENVEPQLHAIFAQAAPGASLTIQRQLPRYPAYTTDTANPHFLRLKALAEEVQGAPVRLRVNESVSDANILEPLLHIPTVNFGPKGIGFHHPDEYLEIPTALDYVETLYQFLR